jgi:hypothetical protein
MSGSSSLAHLLVHVILLLSHGPGSGDGPRAAHMSRPAHAGKASSSRAPRSRPFGEWRAIGHAFEAHGIANEAPGSVLDRRWRFDTSCAHGHCRTIFLRTAATGVQRATLVPHRGYFTAEFGPVSVACEGGDSGWIRAHFRLRWLRHRSELIAAERARYGGCAPASSRTRWRAVRIPSSHSTSA